MVKVRRVVTLDKKLITAQRIVTRRTTVGESLAPVVPRNDRDGRGAVGSNNRNDRQLPNLVPLKSILKMPARSPINRRKSVHAPPTTTVAQSTPPATGNQRSNRGILIRGTTLRMILNVINGTPNTPRPIRDEPSTSTGGATGSNPIRNQPSTSTGGPTGPTGPNNTSHARLARLIHNYDSDDTDSE